MLVHGCCNCAVRRTIMRWLYRGTCNSLQCPHSDALVDKCQSFC